MYKAFLYIVDLIFLFMLLICFLFKFENFFKKNKKLFFIFQNIYFFFIKIHQKTITKLSFDLKKYKNIKHKKYAKCNLFDFFVTKMTFL